MPTHTQQHLFWRLPQAEKARYRVTDYHWQPQTHSCSLSAVTKLKVDRNSACSHSLCSHLPGAHNMCRGLAHLEGDGLRREEQGGLELL